MRVRLPYPRFSFPPLSRKPIHRDHRETEQKRKWLDTSFPTSPTFSSLFPSVRHSSVSSVLCSILYTQGTERQAGSEYGTCSDKSTELYNGIPRGRGQIFTASCIRVNRECAWTSHSPATSQPEDQEERLGEKIIKIEGRARVRLTR